MSILIHGATLLDAVSDRPIQGRSIWIERGRIAAIDSPDALRVPAGATVIDARGKFVIPGLMDANVHLFGSATLERLARHLDHFEDVIAEAAQVALRGGLTTVFDTWGPRRALMAVRDRINAGSLPGAVPRYRIRW
jgi:imidazolonepropionase-like amidohydrolase